MRRSSLISWGAVLVLGVAACKRSEPPDALRKDNDRIPAADSVTPPAGAASPPHKMAGGVQAVVAPASAAIPAARGAGANPAASVAGSKTARPFADKHKGGILSVAFIPPLGDRALSSGIDDTARLWDTQTGQLLKPFSGKAFRYNDVAFTKDGSRALSSSRPSAIYWETATGKVLQTLAYKDEPRFVAISPDERGGATALGDGSVIAWDLTTGKAGRRFEDAGAVIALAYSQDGRQLVWVGEDNRICRGEVQGNGAAKCVDIAAGRLGVARIEPPRLITGDNEGDLAVWEIESGKKVKSWEGDKQAIGAIGHAPGTGRIVSAASKTVRVWDVSSAREAARLAEASAAECALDLSKDGRRVLIGTSSGVVKVWESP